MKQLANFPRVERLPEIPGVPKLTGTGYVIDGKSVRTVSHPSPMRRPRSGLFARIIGRKSL